MFLFSVFLSLKKDGSAFSWNKVGQILLEGNLIPGGWFGPTGLALRLKCLKYG